MDCHPNTDRQSWCVRHRRDAACGVRADRVRDPSLLRFRMKHRSRVEREEREDIEKDQLTKVNKEDQDRIEELTRQMAEVEDDDDREALEAEMQDLGQVATRPF